MHQARFPADSYLMDSGDRRRQPGDFGSAAQPSLRVGVAAISALLASFSLASGRNAR